MKRSSSGGLVYSTESGRMCPDCRQPVAACACSAAARVVGDGVVRVSRQSKGRGGKTVTLVKGVALDPVAAQRIADMQKLVTEVRRFRSDQGLNDRQRVPARLVGIGEADLDTQVPAVAALAWLTEPEDGFTPSASVEVRLTRGTVAVELDTSGTVDVAAERRRLEKDLAAAEKELAQTTAKLGNEAFLAKAPEPVVEKIRARQQLAAEELERISGRLDGLR